VADPGTSYRFEEQPTHCSIVLLPDLNKIPWGDIDSIGTSLVDRMHAFAATQGKKTPGYLVDLSALNYMGSAMVALVVRLWKVAKEKNGKMVVVNNDETVLEVIRLSGLADVWTITDSVDEGLKELGVTVKPPPPPTPSGASSSGPSEAAAAPVAAPVGGAAGWAIVGLALLVIAAVGWFLFTSATTVIEDQRIPLGMLFGAAVLGLIPGTAAACRGVGLQRTVGYVSLVGCLTLLASGVLVHPERNAVLLIPKDRKNSAVNPFPADNSDGKTKTGKTKTKKTKTGKKSVVTPKPNTDD